jgi:hypothetical protein
MQADQKTKRQAKEESTLPDDYGRGGLGLPHARVKHIYRLFSNPRLVQLLLNFGCRVSQVLTDREAGIPSELQRI